jgi:predicted secreted protein
MHRKAWLVLVLGIFLAIPGGALAKPALADFSDVQGHWAEQDINMVSNLGIMSGTATTDQRAKIFSPDSEVSRSQLASVLQSTFGLDYGQIRFIKAPVAGDYYSDVDNYAWYANGLVMCAINKIFDSGSSFYPDRPVSRIELARGIVRSFNAKGISVPMVMMMPVYKDTNSLSQDDMNAMVFVNNTGILKGEGEYFRPDATVTRADLAKALSRCIILMAINEEDYNGKDYQIPVGQSLIISLPSNPTTGYMWNTKDSGEDSILTEIGNAYRSDNDNNSALVGQGGREYWEFKALQAGTTELQMVYSRPWESVQPAQVFKLKVTAVQPVTPVGSAIIDNNEVQDKSDTMSTDLNIPVISGLADAALQSKLNSQLVKDAMDLKTRLSAENIDYVQECKQHGYPIRPYELVSKYQVNYLSEKLMSLYVDYYQFTGGAHGNTDRRPYNFDLTTGQELALKDLFKDNYDYKTVIDKEVSQQISTNADQYFSGDLGFKGIGDAQKYYLEDGFLVVYFSQYEIAPYVAGFPEFKIPLSQFQDGIRAELLN